MKRRAVLSLSLPILALTLSACGSGRHNENYSEVSAINGASYRSGGLGIYNAFITVPASRGGKTNVLFSLYADSAADANQLRTVTADSIASAPATLSQVKDGSAVPVEAVSINHQFGPGSTLTQATFSNLTAPVVPGGYYNVTFGFASGLVTTIHVPVAENGAVNPDSTVPPSALPEQPYIANSNVPNPLTLSTGTAGRARLSDPRSNVRICLVAQRGPPQL